MDPVVPQQELHTHLSLIRKNSAYKSDQRGMHMTMTGTQPGVTFQGHVAEVKF